ncbi:MAG: substrate-binding domain-containing protein [Spirochaetales bacterium]|nr:substrate-binding domain-containing protein [Spirochaetales bacterium]
MKQTPIPVHGESLPGYTDGKKIGLLIRTISNQVRELQWQGVIEGCKKANLDLYCFSGRLVASPEEIIAKNSFLTKIVSDKFLDGLIIWFGGIGPFSGKQDIETFVRHFSSIPVVIGEYALPGIPSIIDDSYCGVKKAVHHLVQHHNNQKILFIRGPQFHWGAMQRYQGYLDALLENNIPVDQRLITPPADWEKGKNSLNAILDEQNLVPGKDFQSILAASGGLALNSMQILQNRGIRVPDDIAVIGYNNMDRERCATPPLTTVNPHFFEMGEKAVQLLHAHLKGDTSTQQILVPSSLAIRTSCGCLYEAVENVTVSKPFTVRTPDKELLQKELISQIEKALCTGLSSNEYDTVLFLYNELGHIVTGDNTDSRHLILHLDTYLRENTFSPAFHSNWQNILTILQRQLETLLSGKQIEAVQSAILELRLKISETSIHSCIRALSEKKNIQVRLREVDTSYFTHLNAREFSDAFMKKLLKLNIAFCFISLFEETGDHELYARLFLGQKDNTLVADETAPIRFPAATIIPEQLMPDKKPLCMLISGIYSTTKLSGYSCIQIISPNGTLYEELGSELNSTINKLQTIEKRDREIMSIENTNRDFKEYSSLFIHALQEPLNRMVHSGKEFYFNNLQIPELLRDDINRIFTSIDKAENLLKDLTDYTNVLVSGGNNQKVDLNRTVQTICDILDRIITEYEVSMEIGPLPTIEGDPNQIQLLFFHLIDNALKFRNTEVASTIAISATTRGKIFTSIVISDNGQGIPPDQFSRIFDIFSRVETSSVQEGTGIGLALCKMIVENHKGGISVSSVPGEGTRFTIRLPMTQKEIDHTLLLYQ